MCSHSPESQTHPQLHPKQPGQQVKGEDGEDSSLLRPHLGWKHPALERHWSVGANPEEGHEDDHRDGAPLLQTQAERAGPV